jgi:nicotinamidase-related amidase
MFLEANQSQLLLIDYQTRLMPAISGADEVLANARRLGAMAGMLDIPVLGTEQSPDKLGALDASVAALCSRVVSKTRFSARSVLEPLLRSRGERGALVLAGCEAHVCLMQSALDLHDAGWTVWVVTDACSSRAPHNRDAALARLAAAGCQMTTTEMVGFEWLRDAGHAASRSWQKLIR